MRQISYHQGRNDDLVKWLEVLLWQKRHVPGKISSPYSCNLPDQEGSYFGFIDGEQWGCRHALWSRGGSAIRSVNVEWRHVACGRVQK